MTSLVSPLLISQSAIRATNRKRSAFCKSTLVISRDEVHLWRVPLQVRPPALERLWHLLSVDERQRADRFRRESDRNRFITARGRLRQIIAGYVRTDADRVRFDYNAHGKPALFMPSRRHWLRFNVSHSGQLAVYAMAREREVGIDLEYIHTTFAPMQIAKHFFTPNENAELNALSEPLQRQAFFRCWTRREAFIKARGEGLSLRWNRFDVSLARGTSMPSQIDDDAFEASRWSLYTFIPAPDYTGAFAVENTSSPLKWWRWIEMDAPDQPPYGEGGSLPVS